MAAGKSRPEGLRRSFVEFFPDSLPAPKIETLSCRALAALKGVLSACPVAAMVEKPFVVGFLREPARTAPWGESFGKRAGLKDDSP